jgi:hypothetical protein
VRELPPPPKFLLLGHVLVEHFIRLTLTRKGNALFAPEIKAHVVLVQERDSGGIQDDFASIGRVVIAFAAREHVKLYRRTCHSVPVVVVVASSAIVDVSLVVVVVVSFVVLVPFTLHSNNSSQDERDKFPTE